MVNENHEEKNINYFLGKVINLEGIKNSEKKDWSIVFDETSNFKLLYILTIIEYLM